MAKKRGTRRQKNSVRAMNYDEAARVRKLNRVLRACQGKVAHETLNAALVAKTTMYRLGRGTVDAYQCPHCKKWHLGKGNR